MLIGGINISLGMRFVGAHVCEEMVHETPEEEGEEEATWPNVFKTNSLCVTTGEQE
jgi:hypothetical protein